MAFLLFERGKERGTRVALEKFPIVIGRDKKASIVLNDKEVSRRHAQIKQRGKLYIIEDLESRNGTFLNGDKIVNSTLHNGDKLLIGTTEFRFLATEANIHIPLDMIDFEMHVAEEVGLSGPIEIDEHHIPNKTFTPVRLDPESLSNSVNQDNKSLNEVYNYQSNLLVINDFSEICQTILKSLGKIITSSSRAAFFLWSSSTRHLIPFATKNFGEAKPFLLSQRVFEDCISRKHGVILKPDVKVTQPGIPRIILPLLCNNKLIAIVHIECDDHRKTFRQKEIEVAQAFLFRAAPLVETQLLKRELDTWLVGILETMIATVEAKDTYTRGHSERVSSYCMAIADQLKLNREVKRLLMMSALCHDIGKIGIPDSILKKASLLSAEEYSEMKLHPTIGAEIINHMPNAHRFISGVKYHHEKWDGTGYPEALVGEEIPFFGRIVAIADVFDAMVSGRAYSGFMGQDEAVARLMDEKELFDPEILKAFVKAHEVGTLTLKTSTQNQELPDIDSETSEEKTSVANKINFDKE